MREEIPAKVVFTCDRCKAQGEEAPAPFMDSLPEGWATVNVAPEEFSYEICPSCVVVFRNWMEG